MKAAYGRKAPTHALTARSDYDQLLFGLALASPLPLAEEGRGNVALLLPSMAREQELLKGFNFRVEADNLALSRPVWLPSDAARVNAAECPVGSALEQSFDLKDGPHKEPCKVRRYPSAAKSVYLPIHSL